MPTNPLDAAIASATATLDLEPSALEPEEAADLEPEDSDDYEDVEEDELEEDDEQPEDEQVDELDEDDESEESDEDAEDEDEADGDEEEDADEATLSLDAETVIELPSGETITGEELEKSILRQADYTRKTQELAAQRKEVETTYEKMVAFWEERSQNPSKWIAEIAESTDDPTEALASAIGASANPTLAFSGVVRSLIQDGKLAEELVERLGLKHIAEDAKGLKEQRRLETLEKRFQEQQETAAQEQQRQQIIAEYNAQWDTIVSSAGLSFDSPEVEAAEKLELMKFARANDLTNLVTAWKALAYERQQAAPKEPEPAPVKKRAKETVQRKRQASAVSRQSASGGKPAAVKGKGDVLDNAINTALDELGLDL